MAFKMKGVPYPKKSSPTKDYSIKKGSHNHPHSSPAKQNGNYEDLDLSKVNYKRLPSEHKDTKITGGSLQEKIIDLEDRIEFIKEDIFNQEDGATKQQEKDIAILKARLKELRAQ